MSIEVGKKYYFVVHAYYHYIGEVVEITGKKECTLKNVVRVHSDPRDFTLFFKEGFGPDTKYTHWPDGTSVSGWLVEAPWFHEIPHASTRQRR